ncbi:MAG TPA: AarF/UbiB family protein [Longimicrobium sp.]|jgi:predicted unusual protein kinase regulating ubiquinone biosynthesis (AarF/ABC1/UbiB family)
MGISLNPKHLKLYAELAKLFIKYGRSDIVNTAGLDAVVEEPTAAETAAAAPEAEALAGDLERLGPTFVKLGQLLSTRPDLVPEAYIDALSRLQDRLEAFPYEEVERIVQEELGQTIGEAYAEFNPKAMAAASLGQVHQATLHDGRRVVVKVQRPGVRERITDDLDALEEVAAMAERRTEVGQRYGVLGLIQEFRRNILDELNYKSEAANLATLGRNLAQFDRIAIPSAIDELTRTRVLTMEYVRGRKITELSPLRHMEIDGVALAEELFQAYLKQILVDGFFHADPHPGNVFVTTDGRVALLDLGMVGRIPPSLQDHLLRLMLAVADGNGEEAARISIAMGTPLEGLWEEEKFVREVTELVSRFYGATARDIELGRVVIELTKIAATSGIILPSQISTLGRAFLALDQAGRTLDPEFDPNAAIRRHSSEVMQQRMLRNASPAAMFANLLELNEFVQRLPGRLNRVLDSVAENELEVGIRVKEEVWMMEGLQKISNRITVGLVLAALIIGAAMMMRVDTPFRIMGYPGLAILLFLAAAVMGLFLVVTILMTDVRGESGRRRGKGKGKTGG